MEYTISNLIDCPYYVDELANWHHQQWSSNSDKIYGKQRFQQFLISDALPQMFVIHGTQLIGSGALIVQQKDQHNQPLLWLTNLYVHPPYRDRGIGNSMLKYLTLKAKKLDYPELYLSTYEHKAFYLKRGWGLHKTRHVGEKTLRIMRYPC